MIHPSSLWNGGNLGLEFIVSEFAEMTKKVYQTSSLAAL